MKPESIQSAVPTTNAAGAVTVQPAPSPRPTTGHRLHPATWRLISPTVTWRWPISRPGLSSLRAHFRNTIVRWRSRPAMQEY